MTAAFVSIQNAAQPGNEPSQEDLRQRARNIAAAARGRAEETERLRRIPAATIEEMMDADILRVVMPKQFGGLDRSWSDFYELVYTVAQGCGSSGWVLCVLAGHSRTISDFPLEAQEEVWGTDRRALSASAWFPLGRTESVDGGFRLTGKFPFSSGCDHAQWAIVGGLVMGEARPAPYTFLVPMTALTIVDDWHTLGLAGTGSKTLALDDVFIPSHRAIPMPHLAGGILPFSLQAAMVGAATGGVTDFIEETRVKAGKFGGPPPSASEMYQAALGEAWADVQAAWDILSRAVQRNEPNTGPGPLSLEAMLRNRADNAVISRLTINAIERVFELSGAHGVYVGHLARAYRDTKTAAQHTATNAVLAARDAGVMLLNPDKPWPNMG
jgi:alkylation response protein AidB-like acyl-CoA dehydrogenase